MERILAQARLHTTAASYAREDCARLWPDFRPMETVRYCVRPLNLVGTGYIVKYIFTIYLLMQISICENEALRSSSCIRLSYLNRS